MHGDAGEPPALRRDALQDGSLAAVVLLGVGEAGGGGRPEGLAE